MKEVRPLAIHVYREMLKQAQIFRQKADKDYKIGDDENYSFHSQISQELYYWAGQLELTPEINPPKQKTTSPEIA